MLFIRSTLIFATCLVFLHCKGGRVAKNRGSTSSENPFDGNETIKGYLSCSYDVTNECKLSTNKGTFYLPKNATSGPVTITVDTEGMPSEKIVVLGGPLSVKFSDLNMALLAPYEITLNFDDQCGSDKLVVIAMNRITNSYLALRGSQLTKTGEGNNSQVTFKATLLDATFYASCDSNELQSSLGESVHEFGQLTLGSVHACAISLNGHVNCWGHNTNGALGLGDTTHRGAGGVNEMTALPHVDLGSGKTALQLALGDDRTCVLRNDGSVVCFGQDLYGSLGREIGANNNVIGDFPDEMGDHLVAVDLGRKATSIAAGSSHTCALLEDGTVKCWGYDLYGQLGSPPGGSSGTHIPREVVFPENVPAVAISAAHNHACALLETGKVKCWGTFEETYSQNPLCTTLPGGFCEPFGDGIQKIFSFGDIMCGMGLADDDLKCWGNFENDKFVIFNDDRSGYRVGMVPTVVDANHNVRIMTGGSQFSLALLDDGTVWAKGTSNYSGNLGNGQSAGSGPNFAKLELPSQFDVKEVSANDNYACAISNGIEQQIVCWGWAEYGKLGRDPSVVAVGDDPNEMGTNLIPFPLSGT